LMNASNLLNIGGEIIMGTIPSSLYAVNVTWATLASYVDVKQVDLPEAQDVCFPWLPQCANDDQATATGTPAAASANTSLLFVAVRIPWSSTFTPAMDLEVYCNFTCTPLPAYQKFLNAKVAPVDEQAYAAARRILGITGQSAMCIHPTASVPEMFAKAARSLGPAVAAYCGKRTSKFSESMTSMVGNLFGDIRIHKQMLLLCSDPDFPSLLRGMRANKILPERLIQLLEELQLYNVNFTNDAVLVRRHGSDDHLVQRSTISGPFGEKTQIRCSSAPEQFDDDEKSIVDCGDALSYALKKPRTSSLPPIRQSK